MCKYSATKESLVGLSEKISEQMRRVSSPSMIAFDVKLGWGLDFVSMARILA